MCFFRRKKKKEEVKEVAVTSTNSQTEKVETKEEKAVEQTPPKSKPKKSTTKEKSTTTKNVKQTKTAEPKVEEKSAEPKPARKAVYRVVYDKEARLWTIKKDGAKRKIASFVTKKEALARVEELAVSNDINFVVHKKDGKFQKK